MTEQDNEQIRARLQQLRDELTTGREHLPVSEDADISDDGAGQHDADAGTDTFIRARNMALDSNADDIVAQIDVALERMDAGTYGVCANCGREINAERHATLPYTIYCVECAAQQAAQANLSA